MHVNPPATMQQPEATLIGFEQSNARTMGGYKISKKTTKIRLN